MSVSVKKILKISVVVAIVPLLFFVYLGINFYSGNEHVVIPGQIYRSGQLNAAELKKYTEKYHIKTIINLRGAFPDSEWYQVEHKFAATHRINYFSLKFLAHTLPSKSELQYLVYLLEISRKPLLFHCEGGADRTGMAAAISLILFKPDASIHDIKIQDSWIYNTISPTTVGYQVVANYFDFLKKNHQVSSKAVFFAWLNSPEEMQPYYGYFFVL